MVRQTSGYDLDCDELSVAHFSLPSPPPKALNASSAPKPTSSKTKQSKSAPLNGSTAPKPTSSKTKQSKSAPLSNGANGNLPTSNSGRKRAATTSKAPAKKKAKKVKKPEQAEEDVFNEPENLIGPPESLLYSPEISVTDILLDPKAMQILATTKLGYLFKNVPLGDLHRACNLFQDDGARGFHDEEWLAAAWEAHRQRIDGRFDEMRDEIFRERWAGDSDPEYSDSEVESEGGVNAAKSTVEKANGTIEDVNGGVEETKGDVVEVEAVVVKENSNVNTEVGIEDGIGKADELKATTDRLEFSNDEADGNGKTPESESKESSEKKNESEVKEV